MFDTDLTEELGCIQPMPAPSWYEADVDQDALRGLVRAARRRQRAVDEVRPAQKGTATFRLRSLLDEAASLFRSDEKTMTWRVHLDAELAGDQWDSIRAERVSLDAFAQVWLSETRRDLDVALRAWVVAAALGEMPSTVYLQFHRDGSVRLMASSLILRRFDPYEIMTSYHKVISNLRVAGSAPTLRG